jgi:hypothetical protein
MLPWILLLGLMTAVAVPLLACGILLLLGCLRLGWQATERATATVVGHEVSEGDESTYYTPVARFLFGGEEFLVRGGLAQAGRPPYRVGQTVAVFYPPGRPDKAMVGRFEGLWIALVPLVVGIGFLFAVAIEVARLLQ